MNSNLFKSVMLQAAAAVALSAAMSGSAMADGVVTLQAGPSTATLPDGRVVPMWGYTCGDVLATSAPSTGATCTAATGLAQNGAAWQPPLITVPAGKLTINLANQLPGGLPTSIIIDGQVGAGWATPARPRRARSTACRERRGRARSAGSIRRRQRSRWATPARATTRRRW